MTTKAFLSSLTLTFLFFTSLSAQFTPSDFNITTGGFQESQRKKFKASENVGELVTYFNRLNIPESMAEVEVQIEKHKSFAVINATVNYDHEKIFAEGSDYAEHNHSWQARGEGVSFFPSYRILQALNKYKKAVAQENGRMDENILHSPYQVRLEKETGDWVEFKAMDKRGRNGMLVPRMKGKVRIGVNGEEYGVKTSSRKALREMHFFYVEGCGDKEGSGNKKDRHFFCEFFQISKKEEAEGEEEGAPSKRLEEAQRRFDRMKEDEEEKSNSTSAKEGEWKLSGRKIRRKPQPEPPREEGKVCVDIWVDRQGNVDSTSLDLARSTTISDGLLRNAVKAAKEAKFSKDQDAPRLQKGNFTFVFEVR